MTSPDFSVLLLAWDEADPSVAVFGGAALPSTQQLVYHLAAHQPVLAVYPHLPAAEAPAGAEAAAPSAPRQPAGAVPAATLQAAPPTFQAATVDDSAAAVSLVAAGISVAADFAASAAAAAPPAGVRLLPVPTAAPASADTLAPPMPVVVSRMVGLDEVASALPPTGLLAIGAVADGAQATKAAPAAVGALASQASAAAHDQWPVGAGPGSGRAWQLPAAPYLGGAVTESFGPPAAPPVRTLPKTSAAREPAPEAESLPARPPLADNLSFDSDPELPAMSHSAVFEDAPPEPGPAEAAALAAPDEDFHFAQPAPAASPAPPAAPTAAPTAPAAPALVPRVPALDGLNARMIEYARRAAQLVFEDGDFDVIYAPNWPTWLAALEIRYRLRRPLVLYVPALAADFAAPAERGWLLEIERFALRRAHTILVPDEALRQRVQARYGGATGRVRVVAAADEAAVRRVLAEVAAG